jgi:hypothetical protein
MPVEAASQWGAIMTVQRLKSTPRQLDPSLEKKLIKAMIGATCAEERFQFRQWLLCVNALVQKRAWRSIFDLDQRNWQAEFAAGMSADAIAVDIADEWNALDDDRDLLPEQPDLMGRERPALW